jgi:hypothetical protein
MNSKQQVYVTADLVSNISPSNVTKQQPQPQQLQQYTASDIFDIPDVVSSAKLNANYSNDMNFIKSINHSAMTDIMNHQVVGQKQKPPSISTKHTDVSLQVPLQVGSKIAAPTTSAGAAGAAGAAVAPVTNTIKNPTSETGNGNTTKKPISKSSTCKNTLNKKVIVEEEDRESAIDYDDDDVEIKKTKLSLFQFAKDITFNLIFAIPFLQKARLHAMLKDPTLAINQIERIFDEFKDRFSQYDLETIKKYICEDGIRDQLNFILESGFNKILSDGVIDINDAPQFNQLVYYIIKSFNDINQGKVYRFYVSREHVMMLLHFVLKSVFSLTLKGQEEQMALGLLDTSFKLVQLEVLPIASKRWYHRFRICRTAKQIEDIIE